MTRFDQAATALNAFWLHGSPGWSRALVVDDNPERRDAVAASLDLSLEEVRKVGALAPGESGDLSAEPGSVDLMWLGRSGVYDSFGLANIGQSLADYARTLTPGGGLLWFTDNPWYWGGYGAGFVSRLTRLAGRALRRAGRRGHTLFGSGTGPEKLLREAGLDLRGCYYLDRDTPRSSTVIPCTRAAASAYENGFRATGSLPATAMRSYLASAGIHALLYPYVAWLATTAEPKDGGTGSEESGGPERRGWLFDAIARLDVPGVDALSASSVLLVKNRALLPFSEGRAQSRPGRGFNAVALNSQGRPAYYAKCRPGNHAGSSREAAIMVELSDHPDLAHIVPRSWSHASRGKRLLLSRHLPGETLREVISSNRYDDLASILSEILERCDRIRAAQSSLNTTMGDGNRPLLERARQSLERIARTESGDKRTLHTLETALLRAGDVGRIDQHGDLWPQNIVRSGGSWWLLDFELYGTITVPLYDTLQLMRNTLEVLGPESGVAYTELNSAAGTLDKLRALLTERACRLGMDRTAMNGVLAFFAASTLARHADDARSTPVRARARALLRATAAAFAQAEGAPVDVVGVLAPGSTDTRVLR